VKYIYFFLLTLTLQPINAVAQTVMDFDGNSYNTVIIGDQTWLKENLKTTHYNNGVFIPTTLSGVPVDTASLFQWAYNDDTNVNVYGRLYTWFALTNSQNVCPTGWHVPDNTEWVHLSNFLGGDTLAGGKMKETGVIHWLVTDSFVDNSSLFTALPGGFRGNPSGFSQLRSVGKFWSTTPFGSSTFQRGFCYDLKDNDHQFLESVAVANCGLSVRCIKNASTNIHTIEPEKKMQIFPNPSTKTINVPIENSEIVNCYIVGLDGKLMVEEHLSKGSNSMNVAALENGFYIIRIVYKAYTIEGKFIKE
jgi:uncharacterized protein (TIGR02145 family)